MHVCRNGSVLTAEWTTAADLFRCQTRILQMSANNPLWTLAPCGFFLSMSLKLLHGAAAGLIASVMFSSPASFAAAGPGPGPVIRSSPIQLGTSHLITSAALSEDRVVNVVVPASYRAAPTRRYPVLYVIDGGLDQDLLHVSGAAWLGALWNRSGEAIVVGIETKDRRKELVGPTADPELLKRYTTAGASAKFRDHIRAEVKPLVERLYRTDGRQVVIGESLAGLFIIETYLKEPALFDGYGAVDPSLWWDNGALSKDAAARVGGAQSGRTLLVAAAKEQLEDPEAYNRLVSTFRRKELTFCLLPRPDQSHATIYQHVTPAVLQYLLPAKDAAPPEYGFVVACSAN